MAGKSKIGNMSKFTQENAQSKGICAFCKGEFPKGKMLQHLKSCKARWAGTLKQSASSYRLLHIVAEGKYRPDYWMHLEMPAEFTLDDLDAFLRGTWVECCDHLSSFIIDGVNYDYAEEDDFWDGDPIVPLNSAGKAPTTRMLPSPEEIAKELSANLSAELHGDVHDLPLEQIEQALLQNLEGNLPADMPPAMLSSLRPLVHYMAESLQQGTLASDIEDLEGEADEDVERGMDIKLGRKLVVGKKFSYVYDFGSSTHLTLKVVAEREGRLSLLLEDDGEDDELVDIPQEGTDELEDLPVTILARNEPPVLLCYVCRKPAAWVPSREEFISPNEEALCADCAKKTGDLDELLPIVNSPRVGVCAYTGAEDWEGEDYADDDEEEEGE